MTLQEILDLVDHMVAAGSSIEDIGYELDERLEHGCGVTVEQGVEYARHLLALKAGLVVQ